MAQIQLAVNFARNLNLRLVVKNKGHDFNAKSTGAGALSIWLNYLQDIEYFGDEYASPSGYEGPAFKIGTGVSVGQINTAADKHDVQVVSGIASVRLLIIQSIPAFGLHSERKLTAASLTDPRYRWWVHRRRW